MMIHKLKHLEDQSNSLIISGNILSELEKLAIYHLYLQEEKFSDLIKTIFQILVKI